MTAYFVSYCICAFLYSASRSSGVQRFLDARGQRGMASSYKFFGPEENLHYPKKFYVFGKISIGLPK